MHFLYSKRISSLIFSQGYRVKRTGLFWGFFASLRMTSGRVTLSGTQCSRRVSFGGFFATFRMTSGCVTLSGTQCSRRVSFGILRFAQNDRMTVCQNDKKRTACAVLFLIYLNYASSKTSLYETN